MSYKNSPKREIDLKILDDVMTAIIYYASV